MPLQPPYEVGGFVLAGGRSRRMGHDKAMLMLAGRPLIEHAVAKLRRVCSTVSILSGNSDLAGFAPVVPDLHPDCGPMGGIEAALMHSTLDWNLILPVDVPFLPAVFLGAWVRATLADWAERGTRIAMYVVGGVPQPALLMIHREVAPYLTRSLARGDYKLTPVLRGSAGELAAQRGALIENVLCETVWDSETAKDSIRGMDWEGLPGWAWARLSAPQQSRKDLWFANLNTPEDLATAEHHADMLDT